MRTEIMLPDLEQPVSHYTHAVRFGDLLFISGMSPTDTSGAVVGPQDVTRQAEQVLENIGAVLDHAGGTFADVLSITVYLTDIEDRRAVDAVRRRYFGAARPASTLVEVSRFVASASGMRIEIDAVAGLRGPAT